VATVVFISPSSQISAPPAPTAVRVVSRRAGGTTPRGGETVIDIDRGNPVLGNPYRLYNEHDGQERAQVIARHARDLARDVAQGGPMSRALDDLARRAVAGERLALRCWCAPRPCHGDSYAREIDQRVARLLSRDMSGTPPGYGHKDGARVYRKELDGGDQALAHAHARAIQARAPRAAGRQAVGAER
jgi:hypothetical protein